MKRILLSSRFPLLLFIKRLIRTFRRNYLQTHYNISADYSPISLSDHNQINQLRSSWQDEYLPFAQRKLVDLQLKRYSLGNPVDVFDVFVDSLKLLVDLDEKSNLLEIGCSSGYYSEVCKLANIPFIYHGCDYSESFIKLAQALYPTSQFKVSDATFLDYTDNSFDVVVSGCCLLHIPKYSQAIKESIRVSSRYVIFHRTPVVWGSPDKWYKKKAYGIETIEIHFNEENFLSLLQDSGLSIIDILTLSEDFSDTPNQGKAVRTFVCKKSIISASSIS
jgi:2-polyprenyl-3-methyl-5-hydroxy-6-metoxy-1,4-benzoquinol methylase